MFRSAEGSNSVLREKSEEWQPCFPHMLKYCNGEGDWLAPSEAFLVSGDTCSVMTRYQQQSNEANYSHLTQNEIRGMPVDTAPRGNQTESLRGKRWGAELTTKPTLLYCKVL